MNKRKTLDILTWFLMLVVIILLVVFIFTTVANPAQIREENEIAKKEISQPRYMISAIIGPVEVCRWRETFKNHLNNQGQVIGRLKIVVRYEELERFIEVNRLDRRKLEDREKILNFMERKSLRPTVVNKTELITYGTHFLFTPREENQISRLFKTWPPPRVLGINDLGEIIGTSGCFDQFPFYLKPNTEKSEDLLPILKRTAIRRLGKPRRAVLGVVPTDINNRGEIVGYIYFDRNTDRTIGFLWQRGDVCVIEPFNKGGSVFPMAINNRGQVPVNEIYVKRVRTPSRYVTVNNKRVLHPGGVKEIKAIHAFLWHKYKKMIDLRTLGGKGTFAYDINDRGQIVGTSQTREGPWHAFLWEEGKMIDLGVPRKSTWKNYWRKKKEEMEKRISSLPPKEQQMERAVFMREFKKETRYKRIFALAVNNAGEVVGWIGGPNYWNPDDPLFSFSDFLTDPFLAYPCFAFLWKNGTMFDLNFLIPSNTEWFLLGAYDINDQGQILALGMPREDKLKRYALVLTPVSETQAILSPKKFIIGSYFQKHSGKELKERKTRRNLVFKD